MIFLISCEWFWQVETPELLREPHAVSRGRNWIVWQNSLISQKALANPFGFRFQFRGLPSAQDLLTLGLRHANANVRGLYFVLWLFGAASHPRQCNQ